MPLTWQARFWSRAAGATLSLRITPGLVEWKSGVESQEARHQVDSGIRGRQVRITMTASHGFARSSSMAEYLSVRKRVCTLLALWFRRAS